MRPTLGKDLQKQLEETILQLHKYGYNKEQIVKIVMEKVKVV